ncbi:MAG: hypothetical protein ABIO44_03790, partial [Saprospiraceae bacterium]
MKNLKIILIIVSLFTSVFYFTSCGVNEVINNVITNEVTAKDRLDAANTQAINDYGANTKLVLIFGKNVKANGKTEIAPLQTATNPDSIGAWLYLYRAPGDTSLKIYTPNPLPTASNCIELTAFFSSNTLLGLIQDTSAKNIIAGALSLLITSNVNITTSPTNLINSDASLNLANTTNPVIKFNNNYSPDTSSLNGNVFFTSGSN